VEILKSIENNVYDGLVLDDNGQWVPIAHMVAKEKELMNHLRKGRVIVGSQWVSIDRAKKILQEGTPHAQANGVVAGDRAAPGSAARGAVERSVDVGTDLVAALSGEDGGGVMVPLDKDGSDSDTSATDGLTPQDDSQPDDTAKRTPPASGAKQP
jgi:hypothetical protein